MNINMLRAFLCLICFWQPFAFADRQEPPVMIDIALQTNADKLLIGDVWLDGSGPYDFLIDTAANASAIAPGLSNLRISETQADLLGLTSVVSAPLTEEAAVNFGGFAIGERALIRLPSDIKGVRTDFEGILGNDLLNSAATGFRYVDLDIKNRRLRFTNNLRDAGIRRRVDWQPLNERYLDQNLFVIEMRAGRKPVHVLVDTGLPYSVMNPAFQSANSNKRLSSAVGLSGADANSLVARPSLINELQMGQQRWLRIKAYVLDAPIFQKLNLNSEPSLILGMSELKSTRILIDRRRGRLAIHANDELEAKRPACTGSRVACSAFIYGNSNSLQKSGE